MIGQNFKATVEILWKNSMTFHITSIIAITLRLFVYKFKEIYNYKQFLILLRSYVIKLHNCELKCCDNWQNILGIVSRKLYSY